MNGQQPMVARESRWIKLLDKGKGIRDQAAGLAILAAQVHDQLVGPRAADPGKEPGPPCEQVPGTYHILAAIFEDTLEHLRRTETILQEMR